MKFLRRGVRRVETMGLMTVSLLRRVLCLRRRSSIRVLSLVRVSIRLLLSLRLIWCSRIRWVVLGFVFSSQLHVVLVITGRE